MISTAAENAGSRSASVNAQSTMPITYAMNTTVTSMNADSARTGSCAT
jgi:hypothetical protein